MNPDDLSLLCGFFFFFFFFFFFLGLYHSDAFAQ